MLPVLNGNTNTKSEKLVWVAARGYLLRVIARGVWFFCLRLEFLLEVA